MSKANHGMIGIGLYTVREASRLSGVSAARIRRWTKGYEYKAGLDVQFSEPVWQPQLPEIDDRVGLGFLDLMEIRFVDAFRQHGVSWKTIRLAAKRAGELFGQSHPFSTRRFQTDGRTIFAQSADASPKHALLDLVQSQYAFKPNISSSLAAGLEYSDGDAVIRWWPMGKKHRVVLDPERLFGQPIINESGVPTAVLANAYNVEESYEKVAKWYKVDQRAVREAVSFERKLAA